MKRAFTLVEMLVVISIIALLAVMSLSAFGVVNRDAKLDIAADSLVSSINSQRSLAKSGKVVSVRSGSDSSSQKLCYGIYVSKEEPYVQYIEVPYVSVGAVGTGDADFCDIEQRNLRDFDQIEELRILDIQRNGQDRREVVILFKPPFAKVLLSDLIAIDPEVGGNDEIVISVALPNDDKKKSLRFDAATALTERIYE